MVVMKLVLVLISSFLLFGVMLLIVICVMLSVVVCCNRFKGVCLVLGLVGEGKNVLNDI